MDNFASDETISLSDTIIEDKESKELFDVIVIRQDLKEHCLENLPNALRNLKDKSSGSYSNCLDYFYTIGYYNRAFYAEGKQLTLDDTMVLDYYKAIRPPERIRKSWKLGRLGRTGRYKKYPSDKLVKIKELSEELKILGREEEAIGRLQRNFYMFKYLLYQLISADYEDKNDIMDSLIYDLNHEGEASSQAEELAKSLPNISRHIKVFEHNVHAIEDTISSRASEIKRQLKNA